MKIPKWLLIFLPALLLFGCVPTIQYEAKLTINSEPPNAKIYEEGKLVGNTPITLSYKYECKVDTSITPTFGFTPYQRDTILSLLKPRSFTAMKDGFEPQTRAFQYTLRSQKVLNPGLVKGMGTSSDIFDPGDPSILFIMEPEKAKSQQQQQQQQQQTVVVVPGAGGVTKAYGTLTIISMPAQAEIYIDGTFAAMTPAANLQVEAGAHKIEIKKNGYKTWDRTWGVLANSPVKIEVELEKI
jgi:hypothetical protein